jgi:hypothetical protein
VAAVSEALRALYDASANPALSGTGAAMRRRNFVVAVGAITQPASGAGER